MSDQTNHGRSPEAGPEPQPALGSVRPIPELVVVDNVGDVLSAFDGGQPSAPAVSDDERTSYGVLLDRAAERGLLTAAEYQIRLRELAAATTIEEMRAIVTELPVLDVPAHSATRRRSAGRVVSPGDALVPSARGSRKSSPWFALAVVIVALVLAMVFFAVYAEHLAHTHNSASAVRPVALAVSALGS